MRKIWWWAINVIVWLIVFVAWISIGDGILTDAYGSATKGLGAGIWDAGAVAILLGGLPALAWTRTKREKRRQIRRSYAPPPPPFQSPYAPPVYLPPADQCPRCGNRLASRTANFCPVCGYPVGNSSVHNTIAGE